MSFRLRFLGLACAAVLSCAAGVVPARAHGGPPLRVGVTADPSVNAVGRLALLHLREGVGFAVDWREFPDQAALKEAFSGGKLDIAVVLTDAGNPPSTLPATADCPPGALAGMGDDLRRRWGGEAFLLGFPAGTAACVRPALIVARAVLEDLRFGILGKEARRLAGTLIGREDVTAVRAAFERGGERAAAAAARAALAAKAGR